MKKLLVITGPTSTGKTSLSLKLINNYPGEIVSADSRQVYKDLDYTTNKLSFDCDYSVIKKRGYWMQDGFRINGYDLVSVRQDFSVDSFLEFSLYEIERIWENGGLPIVVGGTGFYLDVLLGNSPYSTVRPNSELREELDGKSLDQLQKMLQGIDGFVWEGMQEAEKSNARRLIRYVELAKSSGSVRAAKKFSPYKKFRRKSELEVLLIGLTGPRDYLYQQIDQWVKSLVGSNELYTETQLLIDSFPESKELLGGMIYSPTESFLSGEISKQSLELEIISSLHRYVRRQLIWFRKMRDVNWFDVSESDWFGSVAEKVRQWYS